MDDINYLRTLAGLPLLESHYDPQTDGEIESALHADSFSNEEIEIAFDALDILKAAGHAGLDGKMWGTKLKELRPEAPQGFMGRMVRALMGTRVERGGAGFVWITEGTAEVDPMLRNAMKNHIDATSAIIQRAKQLTANDQPIVLTNLARVVHSQAGVPLDHAMAVVMQVISTNPKMFVSNGDGTYRFNDPAAKGPDAMTTFRNILNNPGNIGGE